jgi:ubiquinone/menaquinone biosynthesis C-methylase UbiE
VDLAEYRAKSLEAWQHVAPSWERRRDFMWRVSRPVAEWLVSALSPRPGQTVLELAAGVGETGFTAARELGPDGHLIATDFSPEMVEAAARRASELGLQNVEARVMDAENMDLPDDHVDGVLCRFGYMLMADPAAAFAETRRVLRDGGRLCFSVWGPPPSNPWAAIAGAAMVSHGHMPQPEPGAPGMFSMAEEDRIDALVTGAGFAQPRVEQMAVEWRFAEFEQYWEFTSEVSGSLTVALAKLSDEEREAVRETVREWLTDFSSNGTYLLPGLVLNVVAS